MRETLEIGPRPAHGRVRLLLIDPEMFVHILASMDGERRFKMEGIPADAKVLRAGVNWMRHTIELLVESAEFEPVAHGEIIPELWPIVTTEIR